MHYLDKLNAQLSRFFSRIAGTALVATMLLAVGNMSSRQVYVPWGAAWEVIGFLTAIVIAFSLGYSQLNKVHVTIDLVVERFPPRLQSLAQSITYLFSIVLFSLAAWHIYLYAERIQMRGILAETLRLPYYPLLYAVAIGFVSFNLVLLSDFIRSLKGVLNSDRSY